jgi:tetratricopeptide (TPR) repeat protein
MGKKKRKKEIFQNKHNHNNLLPLEQWLLKLENGFAQGKFNVVIEVANKMLKVYNECLDNRIIARIYYVLAFSRAQQKDYYGSKKLCLELVPDRTETLDLYYILSFVCCRLQEYNQCIEYSRRFLELKNKLATHNKVDKLLSTTFEAEHEVYNNLGIACREMGDVEEGIRMFEKSLELKLNYHMARVNLALSYSQINEIDKGIQVIKEGMDKGYKDINLYNILGVLYTEAKDWVKAEEIYDYTLKEFGEHAEVYSNLGVLYNKMGKQDEAAKYYQKAIQLNPQHEIASDNLSALKKRYADKPETISLCMIVKDEEDCLARCLESVKDVVDEIIVVDTGSTDNTVEIAKKFGAKVFHHPWEGDFSKARNYSIGYATCDWVLYLDADEELFAEDKLKLKEVTKEKDCNGVSFLIYNKVYGQRQGFLYYTRMWRNRIGAYFEGIVHNQLVLPGSALKSDIRVMHYGYALEDQEKMEKKQKRSKELLKKQIEEDPDNVFARFNYAQICRGQRLYDEVIEHASKVIEILTPQDKFKLHIYLMALDQLSNAYFDRRDYEKCLEYCQKALEVKPDYLDPLFMIGGAYKLLGNLEKAKESLEKYLEVQEKYDESKEVLNLILINLKSRFMAQYEIGTIEEHWGNTEGAKRRYLEALKEVDDYHDIHFRLGKIYFGEKDYISAKEELEKYLNEEKKVATAYNFLGDCHYNLGDYPKALEYYRQSFEVDETFLDGMYNAGLVAKKLCNFSLSLEIFNQLIAKEPKYKDGYRQRGDLYFQLSDFESASVDYQHFLEFDPKDVEVMSNLGNSYLRMDNLDRAEECYRKAMELNPGFSLAHRNLGVVLKVKGKSKESISVLQGYLELEPNDFEVYLHLADSFYELKDYKTALSWYEKYITRCPSDYTIFAKLGDCYFNLGALQSASLGYRTALKLNPDFSLAGDRLLEIEEYLKK